MTLNFLHDLDLDLDLVVCILGNNVFEAVNAAINSLDKPEALNVLLIDLGTRHNTYGAKTNHFPVNISCAFENNCARTYHHLAIFALSLNHLIR